MPTAPPTPPSAPRERLLAVRRGARHRHLATLILAWRMMFHDRPKLIGTTLGVVFAVVLATQQLGILFGLLHKNTMFVDNAAADIWITPPGTKQLQPGIRLPHADLVAARATPGVAAARPLIYSGATIQRPTGGTEALTLIGVEVPLLGQGPWLGGPWNLVVGAREALALPRAAIFEDARREKMGNVNLGSVREVNGVAVTAVGFTWGLLPFAPPFAFFELDLARDILHVPADEQHFILAQVAPGRSPDAVAAALQARLPNTQVFTRSAFHASIVRTLLSEQLGITFGTSTVFGLLIGFIIVALSMVSSVLDHIKSFGTLKALGVRHADLSRLLIAQAVTYALLGSALGLGLVGFAARGIRSANLAMVVPGSLLIATPLVMVVLCVLASLLALRRVRKLEPGMVFR